MDVAGGTESSYLDMQAELGISKHVGGLQATDELLERCHVTQAGEVLYVGSGIGAGPCYVARTRGCRVVAVDLSPRMLDWSARRVREEHCEDRVSLQRADVLDLPFPDGRFDAVLVESVLVFVPDKERAVAECVRVTKPGGWVGVNEGAWLRELPEDATELVDASLGTDMITAGDWRIRWSEAGLEDSTFTLTEIGIREETRGRIAWVGLRWVLRAWGRALRLAFTDPAARKSIKSQMSMPPDLVREMGFALMSGRKPGA
jgi:arsenite methyltransferase